MNFMGMGVLELVAVLVVALLVLGPTRMVEVARTLGKYVRDFQRMTSEVPRLFALDEEQSKTSPRQRQQLPDQPPSEPQDPAPPDQPSNEPQDPVPRE